MVGYCMKDEGLPHFIMTKKNISADEIQRGIAEHTLLKLNYMDGFIPLNRSNFFQRAILRSGEAPALRTGTWPHISD